MMNSPAAGSGRARQHRAVDQAHTRVIILLLIFFVLGIEVSVVWFSHTAKHDAAKPAVVPNGREASPLHESTKAVLNHLDAPVEIRFYSMLDPATASPALFPFVEQVNRLLSEFQRQGNSNITVVLHNSLSDSAAQSAASDGVKPFNLDKGNASYLGLAVACRDKRETLVELSPEWAQALEFDLSRAIERVARPNPQPKPSAETAAAEADATEQVLRAIPNPASVSVEEGVKILRDAALKEFTAAVDEMGGKVRAAQQQVMNAQQSGSEQEPQAAIKRLQQAQSDQTEQMKQIAARLDRQIAALKQLKAR